MAKTATSETLWTHVYEALRLEILSGVHAPGVKLKPADLRVRFGVSVSVMREALSRLVEQRLVVARHNQGFRIIDLTEDRLREVTELRVLIEGHALRRSIERGGVAWEAEVVAAHHRLARTPLRAPGEPRTSTEAWSQAHRDFHWALIQACGLPMLLDICASLFDATELYRRLSAPATDQAKRDVTREHRDLCTAAVARDADLAVARLTSHFQLTTDLLLRRLKAGPPASALRERSKVRRPA